MRSKNDGIYIIIKNKTRDLPALKEINIVEFAKLEGELEGGL